MPDFPGRLKTPRLSAAPATPTVGELYYNTGNNRFYFWNGSAWVDVSAVADAELPPQLRETVLLQPPGNDLNAAVKAGWYFCAAGVSNAPPGITYAAVLVLNVSRQDAVRQIAYAYNSNQVWMRWVDTTPWSSWQQIWPLTQAMVPVGDTNLPIRIGSQSSQVSDWNQATTNGWYFSASVPNAPIQGYWLEGMVMAGNDGVVQLVSARDYNALWIRRQTSGTWGGWNQIYPIDDTGLRPSLRSDPYNQGNQFPGGNFNNATASGFYAAAGATNSPPLKQGYENWANVLTLVGSDNSAQLSFDFWAAQIWYRRRHSGSWQQWRRIYPTDNLIVNVKTGTLDGNGTDGISLGTSVASIQAVVITNSDTNRLNVMYSSYGFDPANGTFRVYGWVAPSNAPAAGQTYNVSWIAYVTPLGS